ncbi:hypothetical protein BV22DRAFT_583940 [Leucogyrophana mollusca]|uniref:Uncharacterized protein n=1 Tax=Leucogyrophana mollusca TaxID=85980 RepID=A0ACB8BDR0_9AGAM|nr:hypothetical protein BV22DRAFT_583940 [Leucogyrophana mollusca]
MVDLSNGANQHGEAPRQHATATPLQIGPVDISNPCFASFATSAEILQRQKLRHKSRLPLPTRPRQCASTCGYKERLPMSLSSPVRLYSYNLHISNMARYPCRPANGAPCNDTTDGSVPMILEHAHRVHGVNNTSEIQLCFWAGCTESMMGKLIARHVRETHLQVKVICSSCGKAYKLEPRSCCPGAQTIEMSPHAL